MKALLLWLFFLWGIYGTQRELQKWEREIKAAYQI
jgi:hypothetical protein